MPAARTPIASGRQRQPATMVMPGINRIAAADGKIEAVVKAMDDLEAPGNMPFRKSAQPSGKDEGARHAADFCSKGQDGNRPQPVSIAAIPTDAQPGMAAAHETAPAWQDEAMLAAVRQGTAALRDLVDTVDFPSFVGGLIQNVFQAIVTTSIQQMNAYAEMLESVAQTVDQFAQDTISLNHARDWLVDQFPGQLVLDESAAEQGGGPRLAVAGEDEQAVLAILNASLQPQRPFTDLSDPEQETRLVSSARLQMARSRQQLLASMVLLGINRIVVTDGAIDAKVVFDLKASASAPQAEGKAEPSGEVRISFKSDVLPMETMATRR